MDAARQAVLQSAMAHHQAGRLDEAVTLYRQVLADDPDQIHALLMLGIIQIAHDPAEAEALLRHHLVQQPEYPATLHNLGRLRQMAGDHVTAVNLFQRAVERRRDLAPLFNDLAASLHHLGRRDEALAAIDQALALDPKFKTAHMNRGLILLDEGRPQAAAASFRHAMAHMATSLAPENIAAWRNLAYAYFDANSLSQAEKACRRVLGMAPGDHEIGTLLTRILERLRRPAEALRLQVDLARHRGVELRACTGSHEDARILLLGAVGGDHLPTQHLVDGQRFSAVIVHLLPPSEPDADVAEVATKVPKVDVVFNTIGECDGAVAALAQVTSMCRHMHLPVINPPDHIAALSRDGVADLLQGIPGMIVPGARRADRLDLVALADLKELPGPVLIRPVGSHGGHDLRKAERPEEVARYLADLPFERLYLTDFHNYQSGDGHWRKYRFIFVDRQVFPYHAAIGKDWLVHYWRADMERDAWKQTEEEAFLADWTSVFPAHLAEAVREVARRVDLDYAGMDCGIGADGNAVLFEANACMLVHPDDGASPVKHAAVERIITAFGDLVMRRKANGIPYPQCLSTTTAIKRPSK